MAGKRTYTRKDVVPSEKQAHSATPSTSVRVRVIVAHDGIEVGEVLVKPSAVVEIMVKKGFWEVI